MRSSTDGSRNISLDHQPWNARLPSRSTSAEKYASLIRGSRLVPLDTRNHLIRPDEPAWEHLLRELDDFLAEPA